MNNRYIIFLSLFFLAITNHNIHPICTARNFFKQALLHKKTISAGTLAICGTVAALSLTEKEGVSTPSDTGIISLPIIPKNFSITRYFETSLSEKKNLETLDFSREWHDTIKQIFERYGYSVEIVIDPNSASLSVNRYGHWDTKTEKSHFTNKCLLRISVQDAYALEFGKIDLCFGKKHSMPINNKMVIAVLGHELSHVEHAEEDFNTIMEARDNEARYESLNRIKKWFTTPPESVLAVQQKIEKRCDMHAARNICPEDASREMLVSTTHDLANRLMTELVRVGGATDHDLTHPPLQTRISYLYSLSAYYQMGIKEPEGTERRAL